MLPKPNLSGGGAKTAISTGTSAFLSEPRRDEESEWNLRRQLDLIRRGYELRKARKIGILLVDSGNVYICSSEIDPWGNKRYLTWPAFEALIVSAEKEAGWSDKKSAALAEPEPSRSRSRLRIVESA